MSPRMRGRIVGDRPGPVGLQTPETTQHVGRGLSDGPAPLMFRVADAGVVGQHHRGSSAPAEACH